MSEPAETGVTGPQGQSGLFKAMESLKASKLTPTPPTPPVVTPPEPTPTSSSQKPSGSPLEMLQSTEPTPPPESHSDDPELSEFEKTLPAPYEGMKENAKKGWDALKESAKKAKRDALENRKERDRLTAEYEEFKKKAPVSQAPEDYEELKQTAEQLKLKNAVWALETDKKFRKGVLEPLSSAESMLGGLVGSYKISIEELDKAFAETDRAKANRLFSEIITNKEMNPLDQEDFKTAVKTIQDLHFKREQAYQNASTLNEASQNRVKEEEQKRKVESQREIDDQDNSVFDRLSKNAPVVKDILKDTPVSSDIRTRVKEYLSNEQPTEMRVFAAYASFLLPKLKDKVVELQAELSKTKESLTQRIRSDAPVGGGGTVQATSKEETKVYKPGQAIGQAMADYERSRGTAR